MSGSNKRRSKLAALAAFVLVIGIAALWSDRSPSVSLAFADAASVYKTKCASCHGADGSGNTAVGKSLKLRDLRSAAVQGQSDDQLFNIIAKGKGKMPGYEKSLGAAACKEQVAFTRKLAGK